MSDSVQAFVLAIDLSQISYLNASWQLDARRRLQRIVLGIKPRLEKVQQWERCLSRLLSFPGNEPLLAYLLLNYSKPKPPAKIQVLMARALIESLRSGNQMTKEILIPPLRSIGDDNEFENFHEDLKIAITTWLCRFEDASQLPEQVATFSRALRLDMVMVDTDLQSAFEELSHPKAGYYSNKPVPVRRTLDIQSEGYQMWSIQHATRLLTGVESQDLSALAKVVPALYSKLPETEQCIALQCLSTLAKQNVPTVRSAISKLVETPSLHRGKRSRVLSVQVIRTCVLYTTDRDFLNLGSSRFGQVCLQSLNSSLRELRIEAAHLLPCFIRDELPEDVKAQNRQLALEYLRKLSDRNVASEHETLILAWGQVALVSSGNELNLVLLSLVEHLGHPNSLVCAFAFAEIEKLATYKEQTVEELLAPFWHSIAVSVVQDLQVKPQKAQQLCDLLGKDVNQFLLLTQREILPTLVLTKKRDILQRIASARGNDNTIHHICLKPLNNLAGILTLLLVQYAPAAEDAAFECFIEVDEEFRKTDLSSLVKCDPGLVACELLKYCSDLGQNEKPRTYQAFQMLANLAADQPQGQRRSHSKSTRSTATFFEKNILGILTHFSTMLVNGPGAQSMSEKDRCLKGIAEMFQLAKGQLSVALPQIKACLQSGLSQVELREVAFSAWLSLLPVLTGEDIAQIVDETFALILQHWSSLSTSLQRETHDNIAQLVKTHNTVLQENISTLPSLSSIPLLSKFAAEFERLRTQETDESYCKSFVNRLRVDSEPVILQALTELVQFLEARQDFVHDTAATEHPGPILSDLIRALLDVTVKYSSVDTKAAELCGKALGIVGCLDPNRVEATRQKRQILVLSNFDKASEVIDWTAALFEDVLVKAFKSVTNARAQGFLAYVMQELLRFCNFSEISVLRPRAPQGADASQRWNKMPEHVRTTLAPFLTSKYLVTSVNGVTPPNRPYPNFSPDTSHGQWLRLLTCDLTLKAKGDNAKMIFPLLSRIVRSHDLAVARFILPYVALNVVLEGTMDETKGISEEFLTVLSTYSSIPAQQETIRLCSENVFGSLDYMSTWLREKRKALGESRAAAYRTGQSPNDFDEAKDMGQIETIENFLASIPAAVIANQAVECRSFARALFHWEQYIRQERSIIPSSRQADASEPLYDRLLEIYSQIDEPDGLEGISAHLAIVTEQQQAMNHAKAGRWTAAQAWYELQLSSDSTNTSLQSNLLDCLRETGQYAPLLRYVDSFLAFTSHGDDRYATSPHLPLAIEASWMTEDLAGLKRYLAGQSVLENSHFNIGVGKLLLHGLQQSKQSMENEIFTLRRTITESMSMAGTDSLQTCHDEILKLHVLYELEYLMNTTEDNFPNLMKLFDKRLTAVGSYVEDKQFILGLRRVAMRIRPTLKNTQSGASWLITAKLARQEGNTSRAHSAVLKAVECGDRNAKLEEARLLWHEGHKRQAIQSLESAIESGMFDGVGSDNDTVMADSATADFGTSIDQINGYVQNMLSAKAHLLLAKWLDASGQSQTNDMTHRYQMAANRFQRWEKGHYYLGKHYSKLLDAQKALPREKRSINFATGEIAKCVIDNCLRSIPFGNKYWHETIPRALTLWLELGTETEKKLPKEDQDIFDKRVKALQSCNKQLQKYFERVPPYVFYHALPQLISRITHPHPEIWKQLCNLLTRIASAHPSQALWSLLAVTKARDRLRVDRGNEVLSRVKDFKSRSKGSISPADLRTMILQGQKLSDGLLQACEAPVEPRATNVNLFTDLGFNSKLAPSTLVVPIETTLAANSPSGANSETIRKYKAFTQDKITIESFSENVLVLSSLQRPRKITVRGSDGKQYGLLCKPKDDLRKDQRLMEFNSIINRALKRDTESSKRRLYIKTYAVTPLSEESGTIEWVEGIKPIRDILLGLYSRKGIRPNYNELRKVLDQACASPEDAHLFPERVLSIFPPSLHEWFAEVYPQPDTWFGARLRYARSAAVMSMTGHVLGLGDRHGENILLEESTGGVFHVDFNCLFDKGLTFEKPELVPFRLTHNMVDAMGAYGFEGPFRKSSELTLGLLRQERDTLMTILETFLYDPTTDFVGKKKRSTVGVPETPAEILESVATKLKGLLRGETVPLSVEGHVDALIGEATDDFRLASMYIGTILSHRSTKEKETHFNTDVCICRMVLFSMIERRSMEKFFIGTALKSRWEGDTRECGISEYESDAQHTLESGSNVLLWLIVAAG